MNPSEMAPKIASKIEESFRSLVKKDSNVQNAYLFVKSDKLGLELNIAEGKTGDDTRPEHAHFYPGGYLLGKTECITKIQTW